MPTTQETEIRKAITDEYDVTSTGYIKNPGKFEGELLYAPYFWQKEGEDYDKPNGSRGFKITPAERQAFPEIGKRRQTIWLWESEQGFVFECVA